MKFREMFEPGEPKVFKETMYGIEPGELGEPKERGEVMEPGELGGLSPGLSQSRGAGGGENTTSIGWDNEIS